jgi:hypothetical protein
MCVRRGQLLISIHSLFVSEYAQLYLIFQQILLIVVIKTSFYYCVRYSMLIENGVVKAVNEEPDGKGLTCSLAPEILKSL